MHRSSSRVRRLFRRLPHSQDLERLTREEFWERARSLTRYVAVEHRGIVYILPTDVSPKWFLDGGRAEFVVLERVCSILCRGGRFEGGTFVDVGAHIGTTSISALANHGFNRAIAIEPDPVHLPLLRANIALNGLDDRVTVVGAAMSDRRRDGQAFQQGSRKPDRYRWMKGRLVEGSSPGAVRVPTVALDDLVEDGTIDPDSTRVLWFDCSSCEEQALGAASAFLERRIPLVFTLRRGQFTEASPLLHRLAAVYEHVVDLRSPRLGEPISKWKPTVRPLSDLTTLPADKKLTDVLVF